MGVAQTEFEVTSNIGGIDESVVFTWMAAESRHSPEIDWILEAWDPEDFLIDHQKIQSEGYQVIPAGEDRLVVAMKSPQDRWNQLDPGEIVKVLESIGAEKVISGRSIRVPLYDWTALLPASVVAEKIVRALSEYLERTDASPIKITFVSPNRAENEMARLVIFEIDAANKVTTPSGTVEIDEVSDVEKRDETVEAEIADPAQSDAPPTEGAVEAPLRYGVEEVRELQFRLNREGYPIVVDGELGRGTISLAEQFLIDNHESELETGHLYPALEAAFPEISEELRWAIETGIQKQADREYIQFQAENAATQAEEDRQIKGLQQHYGYTDDQAYSIVIDAMKHREPDDDLTLSETASSAIDQIVERLGGTREQAIQLVLAADRIGKPIDPGLLDPNGSSTTQAIETAGFYPDHPAIEDKLYGKAVARVLATTIARGWTQRHPKAEDRSFMAHLHGPWGSGKSSILRFLKEILSPADKKERAREDYWEGVKLSRDFVVID